MRNLNNGRAGRSLASFFLRVKISCYGKFYFTGTFERAGG